MKYLYIFGTILFTAYGQLIIKWRINHIVLLKNRTMSSLLSYLPLFFDPFILSGFMAAFMAALCWMVVMTKFELSVAYPFMSLSFLIVILSSGLLLHEPISIFKLVGISLIMSGVILIAR